MNTEKIAQLNKNVRIGGKGTPRRKTKKVASAKAAPVEDKHIQAALKKLNVQSIPQIEEVNMFCEGGKVIHFPNPKIQASVAAQTFAIYGKPQVKQLTEMLPGVLGQLGPQSANYLQDVISQMGGMDAIQSMAAGMTGGKGAALPGDDDIPELIGNFDEADE
ncbi:Nascent polypeptide-associated complex subunit beta [Blastocladiella emersonii ATCC 22665]|nr:Nascent polypeptide-associated complex subunit beta [Blastocladiella emersonii ATCC 22665]